MWRTIIVCSCAAICMGQAPAPSGSPSESKGSISGAVKDAETGAPITDVIVSVHTNTSYVNATIIMSADSKEVRAATDVRGQYSLNGLPAGAYRVNVRWQGRAGDLGAKNIKLKAGQDLANIDFLTAARGSISGRVLNHNKEPLPGATVYLLVKEYSFGHVGYYPKDAAPSDDQGEYSFKRVEPGVSYALMAVLRRARQSVSDAPADPALRKPAFVPTYYPSSIEPEGAGHILLRPGEQRNGVDIRFIRAPSLCAEGTLMAGGPSAGTIWIQSPESSKGDSLDGGLSGMTESVRIGADGRFRICELRRGQYTVMGLIQEIGKPNDPPQFGTLTLNVTDRDIEKVQVTGMPGLPVTGRVMWDGAPPEAAPTVRTTVSLQPANRINFQGEGGRSARVSIPDDFSIPNVLIDEYRVRPFVNSRTIYVKDVYYGNTSILRDTFRVGSASGTGELRVLLGHDAGSIAVKVADKDGNPMSDIHVVAAPAEIGSEAALALAYVIGDTDQDGMVTLSGLAPGKYHLFALTKKMNHSLDNISRMWAARSQAKVVEVAPNGNAQVTMEPSKVE